MIYIGFLWLAGGLLLHFLPSTAPGWSNWAVTGGLLFSSGIILFTKQKSATPSDITSNQNASTEDAAPPANSVSVTMATSNINWITPVILLLVIGLGGFFIWNSGMFSGVQKRKTSVVFSAAEKKFQQLGYTTKLCGIGPDKDGFIGLFLGDITDHATLEFPEEFAIDIVRVNGKRKTRQGNKQTKITLKKVKGRLWVHPKKNPSSNCLMVSVR